jgi:hypothetical protein
MKRRDQGKEWEEKAYEQDETNQVRVVGLPLRPSDKMNEMNEHVTTQHGHNPCGGRKK